MASSAAAGATSLAQPRSYEPGPHSHRRDRRQQQRSLASSGNLWAAYRCRRMAFTWRRVWATRCTTLVLLPVLQSSSPAPVTELPMLFMSAEADALSPWGLQYEKATPVRNLTQPHMMLPAGGAREIFDPSPLRQSDGYELWGIATKGERAAAGSPVTFSTTLDFVTYTTPVIVGLLPPGCKLKTVGRSDDATRYLILAFCHGAGSGSGVGAAHSEGLRAFTTTTPHVAGSLQPADPDTEHPAAFAFVDHDDQQLLWDAARDRWVAFQIMFQHYATPGFQPTNVR